jgi:SAM-dependent methyltransferase
MCNILDTSRLTNSKGNDDLIYGDFTLEGIKSLYDLVNEIKRCERKEEIKEWVDLGCGSGLVMLALKLVDVDVEVSVLGVEIVPALADVAKKVVDVYKLKDARVIEGNFLIEDGPVFEDFWDKRSEPVCAFCHCTVVFSDESMARLGVMAQEYLPAGSFLICIGRRVERLKVVREVIVRTEWGVERAIIQSVD